MLLVKSLSLSILSFQTFINDNELIDIPLIGKCFAWSNSQERLAMRRIGRFLIPKIWAEHYAEAV